MITNNGLQLFSLMWWRQRYNISNTDSYINGFKLKSCSGVEQSISNGLRYGFLGQVDSTNTTLPLNYNYQLPNNDQSNTAVSTSFVGPIICVGNGTTNPTREDYKLESCLTDLTIGSHEFSIIGLGKCNISRQFINNTGTDITINEVGLYVKGGSSNSNVQMNSCFMVARKVLTAPIIIGAGQTATVNYTIDFTEIDG